MKLGFIGIGRIATSVIKGLCTSEIENITINISPRNKDNSIFLESSFPNVIRMNSNQDVLDNSEFIFIALPPAISKNILEGLKFNSKHTVISFIPFLKYADLDKVIKPAGKICRAIPLPTVEKHICPIAVFNSDQTVLRIFENLGSPLILEDEDELHTLWSLTGLIAPFYDLCETLSIWAQSKGAKSTTANKYIMDMFWSLTSPAKGENILNFSELRVEATTPNGMNEQALKIINEKKAHAAYQIAANSILDRFVTKE